MGSSKKGAILTATPQALRELLHLPDGAIVEDIWIDRERPGVMKIRISGAGWRYIEGQPVMYAPTGTMYEDNRVDWGLPDARHENQSDELVDALRGAVRELQAVEDYLDGHAIIQLDRWERMLSKRL